MKLKNIIGSLGAVGLLVVAGCETKHLESEAKISRSEAEKIALAKAPGGTVKEGELEKEHGKLIWSFDIAKAGSKDITEVQVDAKTGAIVSVEDESAEAEA
ncbi:MAG: PepSY domain-containing protein, partial [Verrucomicrobiota bacterium]